MKATNRLASVTATALACLLPLSVSADPISIFGVDWSMTKEERIETFEAKGYNCYWKKSQFKNGTPDLVCENDAGATFSPGDSWGMTFSCGVYNGCEYTHEEVAQRVVDAGVVPVLTGEGEQDMFNATSYCAEGDDGDKLCVNVSGEFGLNLGLRWGETYILLEKGSFGAPPPAEMSFD